MTELEALRSENGSLKNLIENLRAHNQALDQTVNEVIKANISFKGGLIILEKKVKTLSDEIEQKKKEIESLIVKPTSPDNVPAVNDH